jgi:hypothetical protein
MSGSLTGKARSSSGLLLALICLLSSLLHAQVTLSSTTSPSAAQAGVDVVSLTGSGFPDGTIHPSGVILTFTPIAGGSTSQVNALLATRTLNTTVVLRFTLPNSLVVQTPADYWIGVSGKTLAGVAFSSNNRSRITVIPPAAVSFDPNEGRTGNSIWVDVIGTSTSFSPGATYARFGPGTTVGSGPLGDFGLLTVTSPTKARALVQIDASAAPGARNVVVLTGAQQTSATFSITSAQNPPVADAGRKQIVQVGATVQLDGSRSTSPNGAPLQFSWRFLNRPEGSKAQLTDATTVSPTFVADLPGEYVIELTVSDGAKSTSASVTVSTQNTPPVANAGDDQTVSPGALVHLDGSRSNDADGDALTFAWTFQSKPTGSAAAINDETSLRPSFVADALGTYIVQLTVNDGHGNSAVDTVSISTANQPPKADAGLPQTVPVGSQVSLDASGSSDPDNDPLSFAWALTVRPEGSSAAISLPTSPTPYFVADVPGTYVAQVTVADTHGHTSVATVSISTVNSPPHAEAGTPQVVKVGERVYLDGGMSVDPDGDLLSYKWSLIVKPASSRAALSSSDTAQTTFVADVAGDYVAQLVVSDRKTSSDPATVLVTVKASKSRIDPQEIHFGAQPVSTTSPSQPVLISNDGNSPMEITGIAITGNGASQFQFSSPVLPQTIPVGQSTSVNVTFTPSETGTKSATLFVSTTTSGTEAVALTGTGTAAPVLSYTPGSLNFGDSPVGSTSPALTITVSNLGTGPLVISSLTLSGPNPSDFAVSSSPLPITVNSGASTIVKVTFTASVPGPRAAVVVMADNAADSPHLINVYGNGIAPALEVNPPAISFGDQPLNTPSVAQILTMKSTGTAPLIISALSITGTNNSDFAISAKPLPITIPPGQTSVISVVFTPAAVGTRNATVLVTDNAAGSPHSIPLAGNGIAVPVMTVLTPNLAFGDVELGQKSTKSISVKNTGDANLIISAVNFSGANASDFASEGNSFPITVAPGATATLNVAFTPAALGSRSASVGLTHNATGTASVVLSGTGVQPSITITPGSLSFGNQLVRTTSATKNVVVSNSGTSNLIINNVTISGSAATEFSFTAVATPITIAPSASTTISVTFTPDTTGARTASLVITDNATGSPHSVTLVGTGTAPAISVNPETVVFANQRVNTASAGSPLSITNTGTADLVLTSVTLAGTNAADFVVGSLSLPITITSGNKISVTLTFKPSDVGVRTAQLTIAHNAGPSTVVALSGSGVQGDTTISVSPATLDLGSSAVGSSTGSKPVIVTNTGSANLVMSKAELSGPQAAEFTLTMAPLPLTVYPSGSTVIGVTFKPQGIGNRTATLTITSNGAGSPHTVALSGKGLGTPVFSSVPASLDFGKQNVGSTSSPQTITISNTGTDDLVITALTLGGVSAAEYAVDPIALPLTIAAQASNTVALRFKPLGTGARAASLRITSNAAGSPHTVDLTGTGTVPILEITPTSLAFGTRAVGTTSSSSVITLANTGNGPLTVSKIALGGTNPADFAFAPVTIPLQIAAGGKATLSVTFAPGAIGPRSASLSVTDDASGSPHVIALVGTGAAPGPAISVSPTQISFGNQPLQTTSSSQTLTITNSGTEELTISQMSITGANPGDFNFSPAVFPVKVAAQASVTMQLAFTPSAGGQRTATLSITHNAGTATVVPLSGVGTEPKITLSTQSLTFPPQPIETTSVVQGVTVSNPGTAPLVISSAAFSGTNADAFAFAQTTFPTTVPPGGSLTLGLTFTPKITGASVATLTLNHNATGGLAVVALSGTGMSSKGSISVNPLALDFGSIETGKSSAPKSVVISNNGAVNVTIASVTLSGENTADFAVTATTPLTISPGTIVAVSVRFTPASAGDRAATLIITDNAEGSPHLISLSGKGIVNGPAITLDRNNIVFPTVDVGKSSSPAPIVVSNPGNVSLVVSNILLQGADPGDFSVSPSAFTVPALGSKTINVTFTPTAQGTRSATLSLLSNAPTSPTVVNLTGGANGPVISLSPSAIAFGDQPALTVSDPKRLVITNTGSGNLIINGLSTGIPQFSITAAPALPITVLPGNSTNVDVTFSPTKLGPLSGTLTIQDNAVGSPHAVPLTGNGVPSSLSIAPATIDFGSQGKGTTSSPIPVILSNFGNVDAVVTAIALSGANAADFAIGSVTLPAIIPPGKTLSFPITFTPSVAGSRTASLVVTSNAEGSPQSRLITGYGTEAVVTVTPPALVFSDQLINVTSAALTLTISNTGTSNLAVSALTLTGSNSGDFKIAAGTLPLNIEPGASSSIQATFTPSAAGSRTATLGIAHNGANSPTNVVLSGVGVLPPAISISPGSIDFGSQLVGSASAAKAITVSNTGSGTLVISGLTLVGTHASEFSISSGKVPINIQPGTSAVISVVFTPADKGTRSAVLSIADNAPGNPHTITLTGTGSGVAKITFDPTTVAFGNQRVNQVSPPQTLSISNTGTDDLVITNVTIGGMNPSDFAMGSLTLPVTVKAGDAVLLDVTFKPPLAANRTANLTFTDNASGSPHLVPLSGTGVEPIASLSAGSLNFGNQLVGATPVSQTLTVTNQGTADLVLTSVSFTGAQASDFSSSASMPLTVTPSKSASIPVSFAASAVGTRTATLNLISNATASPHLVSLTGNGTAPDLKLSPAAYDFGRILVGAKSNATVISIANTGTGPLVISALSLAGPNPGDFAFTSPALPITVAPTTQTSVTVIFGPLAKGLRTATLSVTSNASGSPHSMQLTGTGDPIVGISFDPASLVFANQLINSTSAPLTLTITNTGSDELVISSLVFSGLQAGDFAVTPGGNLPLSISPGATAVVNVTFSPSALGSRSAILVVTSNAPSSPNNVSVTGTGIGEAKISVPASLAFGDQRRGTSSPAMPLTISNTGTANLNISAISITGTNASDFTVPAGITPMVILPGKSSTVNVTFTPSAVGARSAVLGITSNSAGSPHNVALTGTGTFPEISASPASVDFGAQLKGVRSNAVDLTLTNSGTADLIISALAISGTNAGEFNYAPVSLPVTLAPAASKTISLTFLPTDIGTRSATLNISHNGTGYVLSLSLTGTGVVPVVTLTPPNTLDFGSQEVNKPSAAKTLTAANTGNGSLIISDIKIQGNNAADFSVTFSPLPITVNPGSSLNLPITFTPGATGPRSAVVQMTDNAAGSPHVVAIVGNGVQQALTFNPTSVSFGNQLKGTTSAVSQVAIVNSGTADLNITAMALSGTNPGDFAFTSDPLPIVVKPGSSTKVGLTFTPADSGSRSAIFSVTDNAPGSPHTVPLTGTGTAPVFSSSPSSLSFNTQSAGTVSTPKPISITNTGNGNLIISAISLGGVNPGEFSFTSNPLPITITPGFSTVVNVTFKPTAAGAKSAELTFTHNASGSPAKTALSGTGVAPIFAVSPDNVVFADQNVGSTGNPQSITITNNGDGDLVLSNVTLSGTNPGDFKLATLSLPITIPPSKSTSISVSFAPIASGVRTAALTLQDNAAGSPHSVPLSGTGLSPTLVITPQSQTLDFGSVNVGSTSNLQQVTLANTGTGNLVISAVTVVGANPGDFAFSLASQLPITVPPQGNTIVNVSFTPSKAGVRTASLAITNNAAGSPHLVNLTGTGMGPDVVLDPTSVDFGIVVLNVNSSVKTVTVKNTGNGSLLITAFAITGTNATDFIMSAPSVPLSVLPNATATVSLIFRPRATGYRTASLTVTSNAPGSPHSATLTGTGRDAVNHLVMPPVTVGNNMETLATVGLTSPASTSVPVTVTSSDESLVLLSTDTTGVTLGSKSITATIAAGGTAIYPGFYVQGLASSGTVTLSVSAPGFDSISSTVSLTPAGFVLASPVGVGEDFTTVANAADSTLTVSAVRLDSNLVSAGTSRVRGGLNVTVPVASANTTVGTIIGTASFTPGSTSSTVSFRPLNPGTSRLSVTNPSPFNQPSQGASLTATVTAPSITLQPTTVGANLQTRGVGHLDAPAPANGLQVTITSSSPLVKLSTNQTAGGSDSVILVVPGGSTDLPVFYIYGMQSTGSAQIRATAQGYTDGIGNIAVTNSGFVISGPNGVPGQDFDTTTISGSSRLTVTAKRLDPSGNPVADGIIRGGITVTVNVLNSNTSVGQIQNNPASIPGGTSSASNVQFVPLQQGSSTISLGTPSVAGFVTPNSGGQLVVTVTQPHIEFSMPTTSIGANLQLDASGRLTAPAPAPNLQITIQSNNPNVLLSNSASSAGGSSITVTVAQGQGVGGIGFPLYYIQALQGAEGQTATLTASAPGYTNATQTVTVTPAGFVLASPNGIGQDFGTLVSQGDTLLTVASMQLQPGTLVPQAQQSVRGGVNFAVAINSGTPSVGIVIDSPASFAGGTQNVAVHFRAYSVGKTLLTVPPPVGFSTLPSGSSLTANVN